MADERRGAVEWLEEMGFVLPASVQTSKEEENAGPVLELARALKRECERLKARMKALRIARAA